MFLCSRKRANVYLAIRELRDKYGFSCAEGIACNLTRQEGVDLFVSKAREFFGKDAKIHGVFSNVGTSPSQENEARLVVAQESEFDEIFHSNLRSQWMLIKQIHHLLADQGAIVTSSCIGGYTPKSLHDIAKLGVISLSRVLAGELGPSIRVDSIAWKHKLPPHESVPKVVAFLLSADACHITGETLVISNSASRPRL